MNEFSWKRAIDNALKNYIRYNKTQAKAQHPDFKKSHLDEARDAINGNYTKLEIRCKKEFQAKQDEINRRRKFGN